MDRQGGNKMKKIIEYAGGTIKYYLCDNCRAEVISLKCIIIDPSKPNQSDNWIELCRECCKIYHLENGIKQEIAKKLYLKTSNYPGQPQEEEVKEK